MIRVPVRALLCGALIASMTHAATCPAAASSEPAASTPAGIVEIEVTGERAGPRMWKVSKGEHVLWIMGTLEPLPKKMTWRSKSVEDVLAQSQEVLPSRPAFGFSWNPIAALRLYWQWRGMQKIPDHGTLQSTLPPGLYARFESLRLKYAPRDSQLEELRPMLAALRLFEKGIDTSGLRFGHQVQDVVLHLAEQHNVRLHKMTLPIDDPRGLLKEIGQIPVQQQVGCLDTTLARLESDLSAMRARANAWAIGDVDALRKLPLPDQQAVCLGELSNSARFKQLNEQMAREWMQGALDALSTNQSTLALKPIYELMGSNGLLERFRAQGYLVEGP